MRIDAHFLGNPEVLVDGIPVKLEQKKIWALLLYVLYNGSSTRDELSELLWCDYPEESARRNLRNSLYKLKNIIGNDILETKGHSTVRVSPDAIVKKDIDLFVSENREDHLLSLNSYIFLDHFYIRGCPEFEEWVSSIRNVYEKLTVRRFINDLRRCLGKRADKQAENCAAHILEIDAYNEEACRAIMQICMSRGDYNSALDAYRKLKIRVEEDLGVQPEPETIELYEQINTLKQSSRESPTLDWWACQQNVVSILEQESFNFFDRKMCRHCILHGDIGMGKSETLKKLTDSLGAKNVVTVDFIISNREISCYGAESIANKLQARLNGKSKKPQNQCDSTLYYFSWFDSILQHMKQNNDQCVVVLKNMEAIDRTSVDILISTILDKAPDTIWIVGEYCPNFERNTRFSDKLFSLSSVRQICFLSLNEAESAKLVYDNLGLELSTDQIIKDSFSETGGNLLLLHEVIQNIKRQEDANMLSPKGTHLLERLLSSLDSEEYELVEYLSVMGAAEIDALANISKKTIIEVVRSLDRLNVRGWICEKEEKHHLLLFLRFGLMQRMVYERMAKFKQQELHRLAAEFFEKKYEENPQDLYYLSQAKINYGQTPLYRKKIYYNIVHLEYILDFYDEFFPTVINEEFLHEDDMLMSREEIYKSLEEYNAYLYEIEDQLPQKEVHEMRMKLYFLEGRARIRCGEREKGIVLIQEMIKLAQQLGREDIQLKGYIETLCYCFRSENFALMQKYIKLALELNATHKYEKERGVLLRFQGYLALRTGKNDEAEKYLKESVEVFENPKLIGKNYVNLAAAYDYLALMKRYQKKYDDALDYVHKAIDICTGKGVQKNLDVFYEDCGYILLLKGNDTLAEQYFLQSIELYEHFETYWLRSIAESGLSIIYAKQGKKEEALAHFRKAEMFSQKEHAREEQEILKKARKVQKEMGVI